VFIYRKLMSTEGLSEEEFGRELMKYDVVRTGEWVGVPDRGFEGSKKSEMRAPFVLQTVVVDPNSSFMSNLNTFLKAHYPPSVAQAIATNFTTSYRGTLGALSLDDIEKMLS